MAASTGKLPAALIVVLITSFLISGAAAARAPPGSSPLVTTCMEGPFPAHCVRDLGPRLIDIQTALASASPRGAQIAGLPGQVDFSSLVSVAMEAATEAGAVACTVFEGKLPGFNNTVPDFKKCLDNCTVTMKSAMKKLHGATAAMKLHAHKVAETLANRAIVDVSSCTLSCRTLTGDVRVILESTLVEFQKMLRIAVNFIGKLKPKPAPGAPPAPPTPPLH